MDILELIAKFLENNGISEKSYSGVFFRLTKRYENQSKEIDYDVGYKALLSVLIDTYNLNSENVKKCADLISKGYGRIGRIEKDLIKHYFDYQDSASFVSLLGKLSRYGMKESELRDLLGKYYKDYSSEVAYLFVENWKKSDSDDSKKYDYLSGLFSRLNSIFVDDFMTVKGILEYNMPMLESELSSKYLNELIDLCQSEEKLSSKEAKKVFSKNYMSILDKELRDLSDSNSLEFCMNRIYSNNTPFHNIITEDCGLVILNITQSLYNSCSSFSSFMDLVLGLVEQSYRVLNNQHTFVINIDNIVDKNGKSIKWEIYSYLGIYSEHFIPIVEKRKHYSSKRLSEEKCKYLRVDKDFTSEYEKVWYGFSFNDCISVVSEEDNIGKELGFIENSNHLVLIFNKYRHDERKIPCPECAGLYSSSNSYTEVGLKSWECKNPNCPSRSKSNRGKRFSRRTNFMQSGFESGNDIISLDLIKKWRRDITNISSKIDIFDMLIQYFSFSSDKVLIINNDLEVNSFNREILSIELSELSQMKVESGKFDNYFDNGEYVSRFIELGVNKSIKVDKSFSDMVKGGKDIKLINDDCYNVISKIDDDTFTAAVTSPPYYNAREYSQWSNLYLYLSDMYEITKQIYRVIKPGGVYFYNIGDICDNDNTVSTSGFGNRRIGLGFYTIYIFLRVGFELIDNILWDKGEPQSNRNKNDGKFTPYYQRPMNVYEHMFLFRKPNGNTKVNLDVLDNFDKNIVRIIPVIKINSKGENKLGHTAPFPNDIPGFIFRRFVVTKDDIVLEPFSGSGTSLISASKFNCKCLGIELNGDYVNLIEERFKDLGIDFETMYEIK